MRRARVALPRNPRQCCTAWGCAASRSIWPGGRGRYGEHQAQRMTADLSLVKTMLQNVLRKISEAWQAARHLGRAAGRLSSQRAPGPVQSCGLVSPRTVIASGMIRRCPKNAPLRRRAGCDTATGACTGPCGRRAVSTPPELSPEPPK